MWYVIFDRKFFYVQVQQLNSTHGRYKLITDDVTPPLGIMFFRNISIVSQIDAT